VFDEDPERVCILQGPVAVKGSVVKDEPIKDMLGNVNSSLISKLLESRYGGDESAIPTVEYLAAEPFVPPTLPNVNRYQRGSDLVYQFGSTLPSVEDWLATLGGSELNWLHALVTSETIVQGRSYIDNPVRRLLAPRPNQRVVVSYEHSLPVAVTTYGAARSYGTHIPGFKAVEIKFNQSSQLIDITMFEERRDVAVPLKLQFEYQPSQGFMPIHEIVDGRNKRIKEFYWKLWYGDNEVLPNVDIKEKLVGPEVTITAEEVEAFCAVVGNQGESFKSARNNTVEAPMDFAIVTGWQVSLFGFFDLF
jgi:fatty acid synthase subunit alpha